MSTVLIQTISRALMNSLQKNFKIKIKFHFKKNMKKKKKKMKFFDLPNIILFQIILSMEISCWKNLFLTCKKLNELMNKEYLWNHKLNQEGISEEQKEKYFLENPNKNLKNFYIEYSSSINGKKKKKKKKKKNK